MAWLGYQLTDPPMVDDPNIPRNSPNWHAIELIRQKLTAKYQWARDMGVTYGSTYDKTTADAVTEFQKRVGLPATGIANLATRSRLGSYPPPPPPRHACLTFRGTGGIVGQDYTSVVAQYNSALVEEIPILYPASMGGLPVGAAGQPSDPSGDDCVNIAFNMAASWMEANPNRTFVIGGYSLGAIAASKVRAALEPGGQLSQFKPNYVCGYTFGNPSRAFGHTYYLGAIPNGQGISDFHMPASTLSWDWCDCAHPDDLYTNTPLGVTGDIINQFYGIIMGTAVSDPLGTMGRMVPYFIKALEDALGATGGPADPNNALALLTSGLSVATLIPALLPMLTGMLGGLIGGISGGGSAGATGPAAAIQAAILALKFFGSGTAPHVSYHVNEVWPGQTYLGLAIQHCHDWAARTPVRV